MRGSLVLAAFFAFGMPAASQSASGERTLHCVIFSLGFYEKEYRSTGHWNEAHGNPGFATPDRSQPLFPSPLGLRNSEVAYRGKARLSEGTTAALELTYAFHRSEQYRITARPLDRKNAEDPEFVFDIDTIRGGSLGEYRHMRVSGLKAPLRPNEWQKVCAGGAWFYLEDPSVPLPKPASPNSESSQLDPQGLFRLDAVFGYLPPATVARMGDFSREHIRLAADLIEPWQSFGSLCRNGTEMRQASGWGELDNLDKKGYDDGRLAEFKGSISVSASSLDLTCGLQFPIHSKSDPLRIDFHGTLVPGEWTLRAVDNGPEIRGWRDTPHGSWCRPIGPLKVNVAAYRITPLTTP